MNWCIFFPLGEHYKVIDRPLELLQWGYYGRETYFYELLQGTPYLQQKKLSKPHTGKIGGTQSILGRRKLKQNSMVLAWECGLKVWSWGWKQGKERRGRICCKPGEEEGAWISGLANPGNQALTSHHSSALKCSVLIWPVLAYLGRYRYLALNVF